MTTSALKVSHKDNTNDRSIGRNTREKVENTYTSELVIALCTPIGSIKKGVLVALEEILIEQYGYAIETIKLSDYLNVTPQTQPGETEKFSLFKQKIREGNRLRQEYKSPGILAELAIAAINSDRVGLLGEGDEYPDPQETGGKRKCYIIDSLKNKEELKLLRSVYKDIFYQIGVFSPLEERKKTLSESNLGPDEINEIINNDEFENNTDGQNVRNTFIESDFFFRVSDETTNEVKEKVSRYLALIFEAEIITPKPEEHAMYAAKSSASSSACLSRQVGAAITDKNCDLLSTGWNDVPKFGGNLYNSSDENDMRCFKKGFCSNDGTKDSLGLSVVEEILNSLKENDLLKNETKEDEVKDILFKKVRNSTKIKDLIEFSRSVHAEMHAIISGSQLSGDRMLGGKLFCTTYPCHNCARHIVVAGITEVYYIEPYVKSLCTELHSDSLTEKEQPVSPDDKKVKLLVYDGVAPRRFLEFFSMNTERKVNGKLKTIDKKEVNPKTRLSLQALQTLETQAIHSLTEIGYYEKEAGNRR